MQYYFTFSPSRQLAMCILFGHVVAFCALAFIPIPKVALATLFIVLILSAVYYVLRDAQLKLAGAWVALRLADNQLILYNRNGDELTGTLLPSSLVTPHIVILNISSPHHRGTQNIVLMSDSMAAESFRQLRVGLKWGVAPGDNSISISKVKLKIS